MDAEVVVDGPSTSKSQSLLHYSAANGRVRSNTITSALLIVLGEVAGQKAARSSFRQLMSDVVVQAKIFVYRFFVFLPLLSPRIGFQFLC